MKSFCLTVGFLMVGLSSASAAVLIDVDQSTQRMTVEVDGRPTYEWAVSSGKPGYDTPDGSFRPNRLDADHHSDEYDQAPMPYAIFFDLHGHAIHGTYEKVGKPGASHGCVRLTPSHAKTLFNLVSTQGMDNVKIEIHGDVEAALHRARPTRQARVVSKPLDIRPRSLDAGAPYDGYAVDAAAEPAQRVIIVPREGGYYRPFDSGW